MFVVGWILLVLGGLVGGAGVIGLGEAVALMGNPYAVSGSEVTVYTLMTAGGFSAANIGFFLVLFGWLARKIDGLKKHPQPTPTTPYEELARHAAKHDRGEMSDKEYAAHRARLLG